MTKTLTEQWREGTLEADDYYCRRGKFSFIGYPAGGMLAYRNHDSIEIVEEVLAPVPDYKEYQFLIGEQKFTEEMLENIINIRTEELLKLNAEYIKRVNKLEKKLDIAKKALEKIHQPAVRDIYNFETDELDHTKLQDIAYKSLKEIEGVK